MHRMGSSDFPVSLPGNGILETAPGNNAFLLSIRSFSTTYFSKGFLKIADNYDDSFFLQSYPVT